MAKRRISKQQSMRMDNRQKEVRLQNQSDPDTPWQKGLIITRYGSHVLLEDENEQLFYCAIRPMIEALVAGDHVLWQPTGHEQGVVVSCFPRKTVLGRPDRQGKMKPIAANISQILIVVAAKPAISWPLLDSYLVIAEYLGLKASIILNKTDLPSDSIADRLNTQYQSLGYPILHTNASDRSLELQVLLKDEINIFVGQSGVGKSSLIARILPLTKTIQIGPLSSRTSLGQHTTSNAYFYHLPSGGALIDSPGVREFSLWHLSEQDIAQCYCEFRPFLSQCKFRNCTHKNTPDCAIIKAISENKISRDRYLNYVKITCK